MHTGGSPDRIISSYLSTYVVSSQCSSTCADERVLENSICDTSRQGEARQDFLPSIHLCAIQEEWREPDGLKKTRGSPQAAETTSSYTHFPALISEDSHLWGCAVHVSQEDRTIYCLQMELPTGKAVNSHDRRSHQFSKTNHLEFRTLVTWLHYLRSAMVHSSVKASRSGTLSLLPFDLLKVG